MNNLQIAKTIKDFCKSKSVSVSDMLTSCGIRSGLIYDMEKRDKTPSIWIISQIADYLDCSVDYLLGRTDDPLSHKKEKAPILKIEDEPRYLIKRAGRDGKLIEEYLTADEIEQIKKEFEQLPKAEDL